MSESPLKVLFRLGQSVWLDDIGRGLLDGGRLKRLIEEDGLAGLTSNPSIFANSFSKEPAYAQALKNLPDSARRNAMASYEALAGDDLRRAADLLKPVYERTSHADGFVSFEVSPHLAHDAQGSIEEARRLRTGLDRSNVMIKIPGTQEGLQAIRQLITEGVNINITLLFSPERYRAVAMAYVEGLEARVAKGEPVGEIASVASFFLSRIDTLVDKQLDARGDGRGQSVRGTAAVASALRAYQIFEEIAASPRWQALAAKGARAQRLLWASTSTKDKRYSPIKYVEEIVLPQTVNTMPLETIDAYRQTGHPSLQRGAVATAPARLKALADAGVDLEAVALQLEKEGVDKFIEPFDRIQSWLKEHARPTSGV